MVCSDTDRSIDYSVLVGTKREGRGEEKLCSCTYSQTMIFSTLPMVEAASVVWGTRTRDLAWMFLTRRLLRRKDGPLRRINSASAFRKTKDKYIDTSAKSDVASRA